MRLAVLGDVHANRHALEAVLERLAAEHVDGWICTGDLVGYGADPNGCVRRVAALGATTVAGNHDLIALGELDDSRCVRLARESLRWTSATLEPDVRATLAALPRRAAAGDVVVAHGSYDDPQEYVTDAESARRQLARMAGDAPGARVLLVGHTHVPMAVGERSGAIQATGTVALPAGERVLVNPGAVGQSRDREVVARALVLDLARSEATFLDVPYDVDGARAALVAAGQSPDGVQLIPVGVVGAGLRRLRGLMRRL
jgi:diadenosine tetraphosphatase ApaH/serine/threonine PP2A family protein phosphatase